MLISSSSAIRRHYQKGKVEVSLSPFLEVHPSPSSSNKGRAQYSHRPSLHTTKSPDPLFPIKALQQAQPAPSNCAVKTLPTSTHTASPSTALSLTTPTSIHHNTTCNPTNGSVFEEQCFSSGPGRRWGSPCIWRQQRLELLSRLFVHHC